MDKFQANLSEHRILLFIVKYMCVSAEVALSLIYC